MQYPLIDANTQLTADLLNAMMPSYVVKTTDTPRASNTTVANDPELATDSLTAGGVYLVEFHVRFGALQSAGIKTAWSAPSGTTAVRDTLGPGPNNAVEGNASNTEMKWTVSQLTTNIPYTNPRNTAGLLTHLIEKSILTMGVTPGPITFQWAQNASAATATVVVANSYVKWQRIG